MKESEAAMAVSAVTGSGCQVEALVAQIAIVPWDAQGTAWELIARVTLCRHSQN